MDFTGLFKSMIARRASDLHLRSEAPVVFRVDGELVRSPDIVPAAVIKSFLKEILNDRQQRMFEENLECDSAVSVPELGRFRINVYRQRGVVNIAMRLVPAKIPSFDELHLPASVKKLAEEPRGLVLVTGTAGSGKSTTLAAMIDYINETRNRHIVTVEDPIEFVHKDKKSIISQRELGQDTLSYPEALRHVVRQDPDVILLGEMRDLETVSAALTAAQTGHLVLSTLHTIDAVQTVNRIIDVFPPHQQNQVRYMLGDTLRGVISQRLLPRAAGGGRVPAVEVLTVTPLVRKHIIDNNLVEIVDAIKQGAYYGMQTFFQALMGLINSKEILLETALASSSNPEELMMAVRGVETAGESSPGPRRG